MVNHLVYFVKRLVCCHDGGMARDDWETAVRLLQLATQLIEDIDSGTRDRGFDDVRPSHGFAFSRIAAGGATVGDVASHLGVTKQAASQLVEHLVAAGYVAREPHPDDARAWLLTLTDRGDACTKAAVSAAEDSVRAWRRKAGPGQVKALHDALAGLAEPGPLRPVW